MGGLSMLWRGAGLRQLLVALSDRSEPLVRLELRALPGETRDVTALHALVSLKPLIIAIRIGGNAERADALSRCVLVVRDVASGSELGTIDLAVSGSIPLTAGVLTLFRTTACRNATAPAPRRWWRYVLAWVHARRAESRGDTLCMTAADLRCLDVYSMAPRRVYLLGAAHAGRSYLVAVDLASALDTGEHVVVLPATSLAVQSIEGSRVLTMSAAPAEHSEEVHALDAHHREQAIDLAALPFAVGRSDLHGLPVLTGEHTLELSVVDSRRIGLHVAFICRLDDEQGSTRRQMAYVSGMYAEWLARQGRPLDAQL
jgi:hypothetical protein